MRTFKGGVRHTGFECDGKPHVDCLPDGYLLSIKVMSGARCGDVIGDERGEVRKCGMYATEYLETAFRLPSAAGRYLVCEHSLI